MSKPIPLHPFDRQRYVGSVCEVFPASVKCNLPNAGYPESGWVFGHKFRDGQVGEFVLIEASEYAIFGRISHVQLPERERLTVEPKLGKTPESNPIGTVQTLVSISLRDNVVLPGIVEHPRLGSSIFSIHPLVFRWITEQCNSFGQESSREVMLDIAHLPLPSKPVMPISPEALFGRHCAVVGTTGGGKSWTLARLAEEVSKHRCKLILLDATGEYRSLSAVSKHVHLGKSPTEITGSTEVVFPFSELTEQDFFALLRPSTLTQLPKLREAIKSLKLAMALPAGDPLVVNGCILKEKKKKQPFIDACELKAEVIEDPRIQVDVTKLSPQITCECVYPTAFGGNADEWGAANQRDVENCATLQSRIEETIACDALECLFKPASKASLVKEIADFIANDNLRILRVSLQYLPAASNCREVVSNAIGRHILNLARAGKFRERPLLVFLDEAHQFLSRWLGDENNKFFLDSFDLIAKEGRKFSLNICLATQRPRDIPDGVLSQMGALIVHRLIHDADRAVIERASGDIDKTTAQFLPTFAPGEALIVGVGFPVPLSVHIIPPSDKPVSDGSKFQQHWKPKSDIPPKNEAAAAAAKG